MGRNDDHGETPQRPAQANAEQEMKLTDLFSRTVKRASGPDAIERPARLGEDKTDRSSMADLVRLLRELDDTRSNAARGS